MGFYGFLMTLSRPTDRVLLLAADVQDLFGNLTDPNIYDAGAREPALDADSDSFRGRIDPGGLSIQELFAGQRRGRVFPRLAEMHPHIIEKWKPSQSG